MQSRDLQKLMTQDKFYGGVVSEAGFLH